MSSDAREPAVASGGRKATPWPAQIRVSSINAACSAMVVPATTSRLAHYITAAQWESRFSPTAGQVSSARAWLASEGFKVGAVSRDRITISASGTAAQVENAFATGLENYKLSGRTVRLATGEMSVPASVAGRRPADGPARLVHRPLVQVHGQRGWRHG